jgi:small subunit ribosomal protein S3
VLTQALRTTPRTLDTSKPYQERRDRPRRDRREGGERRQGGFNRDRQNGGNGFNRGPRPAGQGGNFNRGPRPAGQANTPKEGGAQ